MAKHHFIENDIVYDMTAFSKKKIKKGFVQRVFDNDMCLVKFEDKALPVMYINGIRHDGGIMIRTEEQMNTTTKEGLELLIENEARGITKSVNATVNLFQASLF